MRRNVLVTGSSHGIGAATAVAFAKQGCNIGVTYCSNYEGAQEVANQCSEYGVDVQIFRADLTVREEALTLMKAFLKHFKVIDVLINNAGGALKMPKGEFYEMPLEYWDAQINFNLSSPAYLMHEAVRNMKENRIEGRIVNISSIHGKVTWVKRKAFPYAAAKGGIEMFTKALGIEVAKYGIRVNCIAPGLVLTGVIDRYSERDLEGFRRKIAAGFLAKAADIVPAILFLSDIESTRYIVGQTITVDGGQSIDGVIDCMLDDPL
jgi:NAD(P)-dependent dehydrogenase (short-subunit alcohol dehydrogenase family)